MGQTCGCGEKEDPNGEISTDPVSFGFRISILGPVSGTFLFIRYIEVLGFNIAIDS